MYIRNREWWKTSQRNKKWTAQRWINHNCLITRIWRWMSNHLGARNSFVFHPTRRTKHVTIQTCSAGVRQWPPGTWNCQPGTNNSCFSLCAVPKAVMQYFSLLLLPTWNMSHPFQLTNIVHTSPCKLLNSLCLEKRKVYRGLYNIYCFKQPFEVLKYILYR